MHPSSAGHLTAEQVLQAASGRLDDPNQQAHLEVCPDCNRDVEEWRAWLESGLAKLARSGEEAIPRATDECLTDGEMVGLLFGPNSEETWSNLAHASGCRRCGRLLRSAMDRQEADREEKEFIAALDSTSPEWQHRMANRYSIPAVAPTRAARPKVVWLAMAAGVILSTGLAAWWIIARASQPERLLAEAYTTSRPFDYRLRDAGYGRVRQKRSAGSSAFDRPQALTKAVDEIQRRLAGGKENSADLLLKGRAELLESSYEAAIESLTNGLDKKPNDAEGLADLGTAFALRGDAENRNLDYCHAIELFEQSLKIDPAQPRTIYNSALVYQKLWLVDQAIDAWNKYLALEKNVDWTAEAQARKKELEQIREHKKAMMDTPRDARSFLALLRKSPGSVEPELYLEDFWAKWLPEVRSDADIRTGAQELGRVFVEKFHDESLRDAVRDAMATDASTELRALSLMLADSFEERNDVAIDDGEKLIPLLAVKRQSTARVRAILELGYNYGKAARHEKCLDLLDRAIGGPDARRYPLLTGQLHIQHSSCIARAAETSLAWAEADRVRSFADQEGFPHLRLRAVAAVDTEDQVGGNFAAVWDLAPSGLRTYWQSADSHFRAQQFIHNMQVAAMNLGWKESAIILARASVQAIVRASVLSHNKILEAGNRSILAGLLQDSGYYSEALSELDTVDRLFATAEPGKTLTETKLNALLDRATIQAAGASAARALTALNELSKLPESSGVRERMRIFQARGLAQRSIGQNSGAEQSFREVVRLHHSYLIGASAAQVVAADALVRESYRNLTELELLGDHNPALALATWDSYRDQSATRDDANPDVPAPPRGSVVLVYAALPSGVAVWLRDADGVYGQMIPGRERTAENTARAVARLASNSSSDPAKLKADSQQLLQRLLGSYGNRIPLRARLCIEADDWLASIPFGALVDDSGAYLAAKHPVTMISSIREATADAESAVHSTDSALIISVPAPKSPTGADLPILEQAREEAAGLRQRMPGAVLLSDSAASSATIAREMKLATLFHFAGHGWANGGNGALLLAPAVSAADSGRSTDSIANWIDAKELAKEKWGRCRLAVLSACLTAAGEERGPVNNRSLVRALLAAGAKRVIAAHWSVDAAATKELMRRFYDRLFAGANPSEALADAEAGVSAMSGWSHPYYWAGFAVFGAQ